jgi:Rod binding domain-containing protein
MSDFRIANPGIVNQSLSQARSEEAVQGLRNQAAKNNPVRIDKAARDFESVLVGHWLEQAEKSFATVPGTDPEQQNDSMHDQFQSIACQALAQGLSTTGGFGIAHMISKQLGEAAVHQDQPAAQAASGGVAAEVGNIQNTQ